LSVSLFGGFRGLLDRFTNAHIGPTATDVAGHRVIDFGVGWMRLARQKGRRGHDLARLAIAALDDLPVEPGFWILAPAAVAPIASMVVIADVPMLSIGVTQERMATPSRCTVQAPHSAMPQPNFVPVMPSTSRNTQSSGVSPSTSRLCVLPLTLIAKDMATSEALSQDRDRIAPSRSVFVPLTCWLQ
jgi:hypothetical protein